VIFHLAASPPPDDTVDAALNRTNSILQSLESPNHLHFVRAYLTKNSNLVFKTSIKSRGTDYSQYFTTFQQEFTGYEISNISDEARWSQFILNSVPTTLTPAQIADSWTRNYT
jgi:hypothetical protein